MLFNENRVPEIDGIEPIRIVLIRLVTNLTVMTFCDTAGSNVASHLGDQMQFFHVDTQSTLSGGRLIVCGLPRNMPGEINVSTVSQALCRLCCCHGNSRPVPAGGWVSRNSDELLGW